MFTYNGNGNGILFNHGLPSRAKTFVTRKIAK